MKKIHLLLCFFFAQTFSLQAAWEKPIHQPSAGIPQAVTADPWNPGKVIVASRDGLFSGFEKGPWEKFYTPDLPEKISRVLCFRQIPDSLFVLAPEGALECSLKNRTCRRFYRSSGTSSPAPLTMAVDPEDPEHWFLGTVKGLLESDDSGQSWFPFSRFRSEPVSVIFFSEKSILAGYGHTLFLSTDRSHFRRVFSLTGSEETDELQTDSAEEEEFSEISSGFFQITASPEKNSLWLATSKGIFKSMDLGYSWNPLPGSGLQISEVRHLVYSSKARKVFAGTAKGVFVFTPAETRWEKLYAGLESDAISGLSLITSETRETLVTLTPNGFFFYPVFPDQVQPAEFSDGYQAVQLFQKLTHLEPSAWEIQKHAVRYANVKNAKIKRWQAESRLASLLPNFSFGKDVDRGASIDLDRGGTNDADRYITGPDDISRGWDMSLSWNLGDFIYSSDQTSIDSREKLMVELRNDILAEVTRIYYERRRLQMDLVFNPAGTPQEHFEKVLRIDELTALLDGFTGKFLSKKLSEIYLLNPDLERIWEYRGVSAEGSGAFA